MRIIADTDVCVGAGQCVLTDPETFDQSEEDGTVIVLAEHPADERKAREAVHICPSQALSIEE
ncbi:(4Fe-4S)-binding protein [Amycolatopsis acidiphila]|uniref:Ferredoxin n=1 Tax=Amycolatopsis acidiphila TaxID=715473 RepID=A0A557ZQP4_9PSEU|nr:ferredoxin [Amycolatopsis acidiphila]TVT14292.1 ferredoxin [Amycolatopsis acidiphila]UIJ60839.1 (4Fe-4S)-binding protein [Amycolatopsis acidiphila]GHG94252.1 ferredoxin [Amycolatopsis acidiphila]